MNIRKLGFFLLGGIILCLTAVFVLFPFKSDASGDESKKTKKSSSANTGKSVEGPPNYDAFTATPARPEMENLVQAHQQEQSGSARMTQFEPRLGVPTFLWAETRKQPEAASKTRQKSYKPDDLKTAAKAYLGNYASRYRMEKADVLAAEAVSVHDTGKGAIIVKFKQSIDGVEVFRDEMNVIMNRDLQLVALSGYMTGTGSQNPEAQRSFLLQPEEAITKAVQDLTGGSLDAGGLQQVKSYDAENAAPQDKYLHFSTENAAPKSFSFSPASPLRSKKVFYHTAEGFVPAYYIETNIVLESGSNAPTDLYYSYVVSATDGQILFRNNLTAHQAYSYRVFAHSSDMTPFDGPQGNDPTPHPAGVPNNFRPPFASPNLVTLQNYPFSRNDPWLPTGAAQTTGNNADAYADLASPDGFGAGDFRGQVTAPDAFDYSFDPNAPRTNADQRQMAISQLFYDVNFLHDWFYDAGFDEASGNAQFNNFGRGGLGGDRMRAEAQDYAGRNNANMSTPSDGASPRMQMYVFDGGQTVFVNVNAPASVAGEKNAGYATAFGPQSFDVTGDMVAAVDGTAPASDACTALTNGANIAGKVALIDRGNCDFSVKVQNAQNAGAVGVVIADNVDGAAANMGGTSTTIFIPSLRITKADGDAIKSVISSGVNVRMFRQLNPDLDGTIDNQIVAHEWGHYISNRLIGNANGLVNQQGGGMGEGWGDFHSLLMTVRDEDRNVPGNNMYQGIYAMAGYATGNGAGESYYFGIRRLPYSTDFNKNGLTFKHISDGVALPAHTNIRPSGVNSQVHNTGEVWASMLWECYARLLNAHPFMEAQNRMKQYLVAGYKATPVAPTFVEARNAILAAAFANDPADGVRLAQSFARRGLGSRAVAPDRGSSNNAGAIESFDAGGDLAFVSGSLTDASGDNDGYLDNGETGVVNISFRNTGLLWLNNSTAVVSTDNPNISFPNGNTINLAGSQPFGGVMNASIEVAASGMTGRETADFTITLGDPAITAGATTPGKFSAHLNVNEVQSNIDDVEAAQSSWVVEKNASLDSSNYGIWQRVRPNGGVGNQLWHGSDASVPSDHYLISPDLVVGSSGSFTMEFDHSFDFEFDGGGNYDGGVVEMSVDGGAWTDIGGSVYNGTLVNYGGNLNPLAGRKAFVGNSSGTIHTKITAVTSFAPSLAPGSTIRVRFRIGTDNAVGAGGWMVDNISFSGITNNPFTSLTSPLAPTAANVNVSGKVLSQSGTRIPQAYVYMTDAQGNRRIARTSSFGNYRFNNVAPGQTYTVSASAKGMKFETQIVSANQDLHDVNLTAQK
jgi:hypothetical protein